MKQSMYVESYSIIVVLSYIYVCVSCLSSVINREQSRVYCVGAGDEVTRS